MESKNVPAGTFLKIFAGGRIAANINFGNNGADGPCPQAASREGVRVSDHTEKFTDFQRTHGRGLLTPVFMREPARGEF
jgi:hypothetical protein